MSENRSSSVKFPPCRIVDSTKRNDPLKALNDMKTITIIILAILSLATFTEGTDGSPTIWNFIGVAALATLSLLINRKNETTK